MDATLAILTIVTMLSLGAVAFMLLTRMFKTIRDLRGVTVGLNDTMRWAVGQVSTAAPPPHGRAPATIDAPFAVGHKLEQG